MALFTVSPRFSLLVVCVTIDVVLHRTGRLQLMMQVRFDVFWLSINTSADNFLQYTFSEATILCHSHYNCRPHAKHHKELGKEGGGGGTYA